MKTSGSNSLHVMENFVLGYILALQSLKLGFLFSFMICLELAAAAAAALNVFGFFDRS